MYLHNIILKRASNKLCLLLHKCIDVKRNIINSYLKQNIDNYVHHLSILIQSYLYKAI